MSPVEFKKKPCHPAKFKGQGPHTEALSQSLVSYLISLFYILGHTLKKHCFQM